MTDCVGGPDAQEARANTVGGVCPRRRDPIAHDLLHFEQVDGADARSRNLINALTSPTPLDRLLADLLRVFGFDQDLTSVNGTPAQPDRTLTADERTTLVDLFEANEAGSAELQTAIVCLPDEAIENASEIIRHLYDSPPTLTVEAVLDDLVMTLVGNLYGVERRQYAVSGENVSHLVQADGYALWSAVGSRPDLHHLQSLTVRNTCTMLNAIIRQRQMHRRTCRTFSDVVGTILTKAVPISDEMRLRLARWCREQMSWKLTSDVSSTASSISEPVLLDDMLARERPLERLPERALDRPEPAHVELVPDSPGKRRRPDRRSAISGVETVYDGDRFRSRTEARMAVFFNELAKSYPSFAGLIFEPMKVDLAAIVRGCRRTGDLVEPRLIMQAPDQQSLQTRNYIVDFLLPHLGPRGTLIEVKPQTPCLYEIQRCAWLSRMGTPVAVFVPVGGRFAVPFVEYTQRYRKNSGPSEDSVLRIWYFEAGRLVSSAMGSLLYETLEGDLQLIHPNCVEDLEGVNWRAPRLLAAMQLATETRWEA